MAQSKTYVACLPMKKSITFYCLKSLSSNTACIMYVTQSRSRSIHLRSRSHSLSFLRFEYWNGASNPSSLPLSSPFFSVSSIKAPKLSWRIKYRGSPGKKKRFPPINFRSPFPRRSCESRESFSSPSRHIISSNHRPTPPIGLLLSPLSFPFSLSLSAAQSTLSYTPSSGDPRIRYNREPGTTQP